MLPRPARAEPSIPPDLPLTRAEKARREPSLTFALAAIAGAAKPRKAASWVGQSAEFTCSVLLSWSKLPAASFTTTLTL
jgi:hypothetical protein